MTSSGTYTFGLDGGDIMAEAFERCGLSMDAVTGPMTRSARRSLNLLSMDFQNRGLNLWQIDLQSTALTTSQQTVTTATATSDVLNVYITSGGTDYLMVPIGRGDYDALSVKTTTGRPTQYWCERTLPVPIMHLYPVPDVATYTLNYHRIRQPQDFSALSQTPDAPVLWLEAVISDLALRVAVKWANDKVAMLAPMAAQAFQNAAGEGRERVPFIARPLVT